jgi:hypothetical protein
LAWASPLGLHLGYTVPRGVVHRTRAQQRTVILMVEAARVTPQATLNRS